MIFIWLGLRAQANHNFLYERIEIRRNNISFRDLFLEIGRQRNIQFIYNNDEFDDKKRISPITTEKNLKDVLDKALLGTNFTWYLKDEFVIVRPINIALKDGNVKIKSIDSLIDVSGIIRDAKGEPIPGATVSVIGSKIGTLTSNDGKFSIKGVPKNSMLKITNIGFVELFLKSELIKQNSTIVMVESVSVLDATVVEAYSITSKRYSTSGISTITAKDIEKKPITNVLLALQGEVPGIVVQQSSGLSNSGISVQIRGLNSLTQGIDPLYVIDGVPYTSQLLGTVNGISLGFSGNENRTGVQQGNPLSFINPSDIESISILKDADATSIYGSRAAAGAVIITTKKGKAGPNRLNINLQEGWGKVSRFMDLLNKEEYLKMRHEAIANSNIGIQPTDYDLNGTWDTTRSTDWQRTLLGGTAKYTDLQLSTSGGTENTRFLVGGGYHRESSVFINDLVNKKGSMHFNVTSTTPNQKFNLQLSGSYMADHNAPPVLSPSSLAVMLPPVAPPLYNKDGSINWAQNASGNSTWSNPLALTKANGISKTNNLVSNIQLSYELLPGLRFKGNLGYNNMQINETRTRPSSSIRPEYQAFIPISAAYSNGSIKSWVIEPQITYEIADARGKFEALIGSTLQNNNNSQQIFQGTGYSSEVLLQDPKSAGNIQILSTIANTYKYNALFGRLNYRLKNKYIVNLSARRDGSSRFGSENLFHNFGSIGAAWIFSDEAFFTKKYLKFLSFGKLQFSYGTTGNDQIGDYQYLNVFLADPQQNNYQGITGLYINGLSNPYLQWEETKKLQFSTDLGFLNNRILFNVTYFRNRSSNQLLNYSLPSITGFGGYTRNFPATLQNTGWELSLNTDIIKREIISWTSRFNIYIPQNKVVAFSNLSSSSYSTIYEIGQPITRTRVLMSAGVNPETGYYQFKDIKGNITTSPNIATDSKFINLAPEFTGGFSNSLTFKGFQLDVLVQFNKQWIQNQKIGFAIPGYLNNQPKSLLDRWKKAGDEVSIQKPVSGFTADSYLGYYNALASDFNYINCYLLRVKNVSLSWHLPKDWCRRSKIQSGQIFLHAQNLFTFTNFIGSDPEIGPNGPIPILRVTTIGLQLTL